MFATRLSKLFLNNINRQISYVLLQIMSSKRKSPPTKLDGSNGTVDSKLSSQDVDLMASTEIDLSIKSSPHFSDNETSNEHRISPSSEINHHNQVNGEQTSGKAKRRGGDMQVSFAIESIG